MDIEDIIPSMATRASSSTTVSEKKTDIIISRII
jgi:hypothetical protein